MLFFDPSVRSVTAFAVPASRALCGLLFGWRVVLVVVVGRHSLTLSLPLPARHSRRSPNRKKYERRRLIGFLIRLKRADKALHIFLQYRSLLVLVAALFGPPFPLTDFHFATTCLFS